MTVFSKNDINSNLINLNNMSEASLTSSQQGEDIYPEDEAIALMSEELPVPGFADPLLGRGNMRALKTTLDNEELMETDLLLATGGLSLHEFDEYVMQIPELSTDVRKALHKIAEQMFEELQIKIPRYIEQNFNRHGDMKMSTDTGLVKLIIGIESIMTSQMRHLAALRNALVRETRNYLYQLLSTEVMIYAEDCSEMRKELIFRMLEELTNAFRATYNIDFPGHVIKVTLGNSLNVIDKNKDTFGGIIETIGRPDDTLGNLKTQTDAQFERAQELSLFRKVDDITNQIGNTGAEVCLYTLGKTPLHSERVVLLCNAVIKLDPSQTYHPPKIVNTDEGGGTVEHFTSGGSFEIDIDRQTGELTFIHTNMPISGLFKKAEDYYKFKRMIYTMILQNLESKEDDIEEYLVGLSERDKMQLNKIRQEAAAAAKQVFDAKFKQLLTEEERTEQEWHAQFPGDVAEKVEERVAETSGSQSEENEEPTPKLCTKFLRGLNGREVKSALTRLLGSPISITGSHNKFRCRDGGTYPIPIHDSQEVNIGILLRSLKRYGIPLTEFYEEV